MRLTVGKKIQGSGICILKSLQIVVLLAGVFGALAAPGVPGTSGALSVARNITEDAEVFLGPPLPGSENLDEKAMPLSKLVTPDNILPAGQNLAEKSQPPRELPGNRNLAEKRIPEQILRKLFEPLNVDQQKL